MPTNPRIATRPDLLAQQLLTASAGIVGTPNWPVQAPTAAQCANRYNSLNGLVNLVNAAEAALTAARLNLRNDIDAGHDEMVGVDDASDLIVGRNSPLKANYGFPVTQPPPPPGPPDQVAIKTIKDGVAPSSIFIDWETVPNASAYEVEWFTSSALTLATRVGNVTRTQSEFTTGTLTQGQQYWFRVRAIRANQPGPWSDVATRVAGV